MCAMTGLLMSNFASSASSAQERKDIRSKASFTSEEAFQERTNEGSIVPLARASHRRVSHRLTSSSFFGSSTTRASELKMRRRLVAENDPPTGEASPNEPDGVFMFFNPFSATYLEDLTGIPLPADLEPAARSFRKNLESVRDTAGLAWAHRYFSHRGVELGKLRREIAGSRPTATDDELAMAALEKWSEQISQPDFEKALLKKVIDDLVMDLKEPVLASAVVSLSRQGAVMTWTAAETLAQDVFRAVLNDKPTAAIRFLKSKAATAVFDVQDRKRLIWGMLIGHSLDLSSCIADLLLEIKKIDDI